MQLTPNDKESLIALSNSRGWQIICEALDEDIKKKDIFLLTPSLSNVVQDPVKQMAIINDEQKQRAFLV
jgi:hypothetical protein